MLLNVPLARSHDRVKAEEHRRELFRTHPPLNRTTSGWTLKAVASLNGPTSQAQIQVFENARPLLSMKFFGNFESIIGVYALAAVKA
jgi:hypothetical protein